MAHTADRHSQDRPTAALIATLIIVAFVSFGVWAYTGGVERHPDVFSITVPDVRVDVPSPALPPNANQAPG